MDVMGPFRLTSTFCSTPSMGMRLAWETTRFKPSRPGLVLE